MKRAREQVNREPGAAILLDGVCLSSESRARAQAQLRKADRIANGVMRFAARIRAVVMWVERGIAEIIAQSESRISAALDDQSDSRHV